MFQNSPTHPTAMRRFCTPLFIPPDALPEVDVGDAVPSPVAVGARENRPGDDPVAVANADGIGVGLVATPGVGSYLIVKVELENN